MRSVLLYLTRTFPSLSRKLPISVRTVNPDPIIVLGNQKAGTSAITHLLAEFGGLSKTVDIPESWAPSLYELLSGAEKLSTFAKDHPHRFFADVIKEPNLTFFFSDLCRLYPSARFVFVVRDPRANIRSMLNRMDVAGNRESIRVESVDEAWRHLFNARAWELSQSHYVAQLAERWVRAARVYLDHAEHIHLVRFEDFLADKAGTIEHLATALEIPNRQDITELVDVQYQPRGDRDISWEEFFGEANLHCIERICSDAMAPLGYSPRTLSSTQ